MMMTFEVAHTEINDNNMRERLMALKIMRSVLWFIAALMVACTGPKISIAPGLHEATHRVAVLTFASSGFLGSRRLGKFAADELTKFLALQQRAVVVDRGLVNSAAASAGITSPNFLTRGQLKSLALELNVQLVVLGEVLNMSSSAGSLSDGRKWVQLSCRILDPDSGALVGLLSHEGHTTGSILSLVSSMIEQMVSAMKSLRIPLRTANSGGGAVGQSTAEKEAVAVKTIKPPKR